MQTKQDTYAQLQKENAALKKMYAKTQQIKNKLHKIEELGQAEEFLNTLNF